MMMLSMQGQWPHVVNFLLYLAAALPLLGIGVWLFARLTPYKEGELLHNGAQDGMAGRAAEAAAHDLGGKLLGLTLVLASAIFHSVHIWDLLFWGAVGIVSQVLVAKLFEWITPYQVAQEIPKGNVAVGIFSARLSVAAGLLLAALISY